MTPFNPFAQLTEHITGLFTGLFADTTTVVLGVIVLAFVVFGAGVINEALGGFVRSRERSYHLERSSKYLEERAEFDRGSVEWLERDYLFKHHVRKAAHTQIRRDD